MISTQIISLLLGTIAAPSGGSPDKRVAQLAIVGTVGSKVRPKKILESDGGPPYITVRQLSGRSGTCFAGPTGDAHASVAILCHGIDTVAADAVADNVRILFNGYATPSWQTPANKIRGTFIEDLSEDWDADIHGGELGVHVTPVVIKVWYDE